jgi:type VI secretion system protein ImpA
MSPEQEILDIEAILQPISEDAPSGVNLRPLGVYDEVKALRTTESADSMVGTLRPGEFKTAQWGKAISTCVKELSTRSKDLQLAVWLAEALVRVHGFRGLLRGLEFIVALNNRFFPTYFPPIEDGGLDMRAGRFAELERLLTQAVDNCAMTAKVEGESHAFWEWKQIQVLFANAGRAKPEEKDQILAEANTKKEVVDKAIAKTSWEFYDDGILQPLIRSQGVLTELRETLDRLFAAEPAFGEMEDGVTGFSDLRKELDECRLRVEGILSEKPAPPGKRRDAAPLREDASADAAGAGSAGMRPGSGSGGSLSAEPESRADALRRLASIAQFFQRTEPHSPVAYLVQRAVRWGEMPLENWLDEVIADANVLNALRETLGLPKKSEY